MSVSYSLSGFTCSRPRKCCNSSSSEAVNSEIDSPKRALSTVTFAEGPNSRIREAFSKVELSVSSYDTAWVAMVPSPRSLHTPCFPECIYWILENQHLDGSWGLPNRPPYLMKDALSSTLACVIALKRWNIGEEHVKRGLHFIGSNFSLATDAKQHSPIGFDIIFPGMIKHANDMGLHLHMATTNVDSVLCMQELALKRGSGRNSEGWKAFLAYVAEGLGKSQDWKEVMKYQRQNGSLFNSPSTTAAALTYCWDAKGHDYLCSLLRKFGNAVPTTYPLDIYTHLCMVDSLESMGVAQHFRDEIKIVLDNTYRCWLHSDDEIYGDIATCALAFRILRVNGYDVSSGALSQLNNDVFFSSLDEHLKDTRAVLELYKASQIKTSQDEQGLDKLNFWSSDFLKQKISRSVMQDELQQLIIHEVNYALKFPSFANLERLEHKRIIENYSVDTFKIMKTSFMTENIDSKDILQLAVEDFKICQSIYHEELDLLERWVANNRLDQLKFARQKLKYCYFSAAATLFHPDMSDVRMSWAKNAVLTTVIDDFFDVGGSLEELKKFIGLVEKWDGNHGSDSCSEQVRIVFSALYSTINELGAKASALQRQRVTSHLIEIWLNLIKSMMTEAEWRRDKIVPTMDEYMTNGYVSIALGPIILPALYFVGPRLSWDIIGDPEYHNLFKLVSTCGRLLNDIQGFEREGSEGKLNSVSLYMLHGSGGTISVEEAKKDLRVLIETSRIELLRLVLQTEGSVVPRACKDLFWKMCKILHLFYMNNDGFTSPKEMVGAVNAVIHEPLKVPNILLSDD